MGNILLSNIFFAATAENVKYEDYQIEYLANKYQMSFIFLTWKVLSKVGSQTKKTDDFIIIL